LLLHPRPIDSGHLDINSATCWNADDLSKEQEISMSILDKTFKRQSKSQSTTMMTIEDAAKIVQDYGAVMKAQPE
jgi:hypothetical protein